MKKVPEGQGEGLSLHEGRDSSCSSSEFKMIFDPKEGQEESGS